MRRDNGTAAVMLPSDIDPAARVASVALPVISSASTADDAKADPLAMVAGITELMVTAMMRR